MNSIFKILFFITFFHLFVLVGYSQKNVLASIPKNGKSFESFVPKGYEVLGNAKGDLNKDSLEDVVMVLKSVKENDDDSISDALPPRILVILLRTNNGYALSATSNTTVLCRTCGGAFGDPFENIQIEKQVITISHYAGSNWRWALTYKFRYQKDNWYLIGKTNYSYFDGAMCDDQGSKDGFVSTSVKAEALKDEFVSTNYKDENLVTGDIYIKKISDDCKKTEKRYKVKPKPLISLQVFNAEKDLENNQN